MDEFRIPLKSILLFIVLFFVAWAFRATIFYSFDTEIQSEAARLVYSNAVKFVIWVIPVFVYLKYIDRRNPFKYLKLTSPIQKTNLLYAVIIIFLYFLSVLFISLFMLKQELSFNSSSSALVSTSVSSLLEEILFRGFILTKLNESIKFWAANIITAFLFVLIHYPHWLWTKGIQWQILIDSVSIFILACFLGYLVKKTNSLLPSIGAHIGNNFLASFLRA